MLDYTSISGLGFVAIHSAINLLTNEEIRNKGQGAEVHPNLSSISQLSHQRSEEPVSDEDVGHPI